MQEAEGPSAAVFSCRIPECGPCPVPLGATGVGAGGQMFREVKLPIARSLSSSNENERVGIISESNNMLVYLEISTDARHCRKTIKVKSLSLVLFSLLPHLSSFYLLLYIFYELPQNLSE